MTIVTLTSMPTVHLHMAEAMLDKFLATLSVEVHTFALCNIADGWRLTTGAMPELVLHYILEGSGTLRTNRGRAVPFRRGSVLIVPPGHLQNIGPEGAAAEMPHHRGLAMRDDGVALVRAGSGKPQIVFACGTLSASCAGGIGLFSQLREPIVEDLTSYEQVEHAFALMMLEMANPGLGSRALVEALMKQCLVLVLRCHLRRLDTHSPLFASFLDRRLARAAAHVLEHPSGPHTVASLAALAGMSRAVFAQRFVQVFARTPMAFVQSVRLELGARLLANTDFPVKLIAHTLGYASRAYFSTAFRKTYGLDPSGFRTRSNGECSSEQKIAPERVDSVRARDRAMSVEIAASAERLAFG